jgi:4-hydroxy-3-methylbut-2-enyl diphosphate reductase IspH
MSSLHSDDWDHEISKLMDLDSNFPSDDNDRETRVKETQNENETLEDKSQQFSNSCILTKTQTTIECEDLESVNEDIKDLDKEDATSSKEHICKKGNENNKK